MIKNIDFAKIDWVPTIFLLVTPPLAIYFGVFYISKYGFDWPLALLTIFFYYACGMSITAGYHRLFSHKAYEANKFVKAFFLFFGAASFQHSALNWCAGHRIHHRYVDTDLDPYNAKRGFWYSHLLWMFEKKNILDSEHGQRMSQDLRKDKMLAFQHDHYLLIAIFSGFIFPGIIGLGFDRPFGAIIFAGLVRMVCVHHFTYFINSICHIFGSQNYGQENTARDSWWVSLLTYGEGYHNFHHHFQNDYRNGIRWYDFDPTKWLIYLFSVVGWAKNLKVTSEVKIIASRTNYDQFKIHEVISDTLDPLYIKVNQLKNKIDSSLLNYSSLQAKYKDVKGKKLSLDKTSLNQLKQDLKKARKELYARYEDWQATIISIHSLGPQVQIS